MSTYIFRRLLQAIPTFFGVTIIAFLMMLSAPGDPIDLITFNPTRADPAATESLRRKLGLDQPPMVQYVYWLAGNDWAKFDTDGDGVPDTYGERKGLLAFLLQRLRLIQYRRNLLLSFEWRYRNL